AASAVPRLIAVVVFPTPPFWLATTRMRGLAPFSVGISADMAKFPDFQNDARRVRSTLVLADLHPPRFTGFGQFSRYRLTLEKQADGVTAAELLCVAKEEGKRRQCPRGD